MCSKLLSYLSSPKFFGKGIGHQMGNNQCEPLSYKGNSSLLLDYLPSFLLSLSSPIPFFFFLSLFLPLFLFCFVPFHSETGFFCTPAPAVLEQLVWNLQRSRDWRCAPPHPAPLVCFSFTQCLLWADFELQVFLPPPAKCWDYRHEPHKGHVKMQNFLLPGSSAASRGEPWNVLNLQGALS